MATEHAVIPDAQRHEPKGASTATAGQVYVSDGAASGAWQVIGDTTLGLTGGTATDVLHSNGAGGWAWGGVVDVDLDGIAASPTAGKVATFVGDGTFAADWVGSDQLDGTTPAAKVVMVADGATGWTHYPPVYGQVYFNNPGSPFAWTYSATYTLLNPTSTVGGFASTVTESTATRLTYTGTPTRALKVRASVSFKQTTGAKDITVALYKDGAAITGCESVVTTGAGTWHHVTLEWVVSAATNAYFEVYMKNGGGSENVDVGDLHLSVVGVV